MAKTFRTVLSMFAALAGACAVAQPAPQLANGEYL
jgi:hypothetical protein